jgi:hypothetical protein
VNGRARHGELTRLLSGAVQSRTELSSGYLFAIPVDLISLSLAAEWISLERRCCPFLSFRLEVPADGTVFHIAVEGEEGTSCVLCF